MQPAGSRFHAKHAPLPLPLWRPWEELIWVLVGALALGLLADGWLINLALNIAVVMAVLYGTQGVAGRMVQVGGHPLQASKTGGANRGRAAPAAQLDN